MTVLLLRYAILAKWKDFNGRGILGNCNEENKMQPSLFGNHITAFFRPSPSQKYLNYDQLLPF